STRPRPGAPRLAAGAKLSSTLADTARRGVVDRLNETRTWPRRDARTTPRGWRPRSTGPGSHGGRSAGSIRPAGGSAGRVRRPGAADRPQPDDLATADGGDHRGGPR